MEFSEFAKILRPLIANGMPAGAFVRDLFENITVFPESMTDNPIIKTGDNTFRSYYTGNRKLTQFVPKIARYVDMEMFVNYITNVGDDAQDEIYQRLKPYWPDMEESNIPFGTAQLFKSIIFSYATEKPSGKIESASAKAEPADPDEDAAGKKPPEECGSLVENDPAIASLVRSKTVYISHADRAKVCNILDASLRGADQRPFNTDYYNLFVLFGADLSAGYFVMYKERVLQDSYMQPEIRERYLELTPTKIAEIKTFPAIIANESTGQEEQLAICAEITGIREQENGVKVHFRPLFYIPQNQLVESAEKFALGPSGRAYALSHTHWAIKYMNLFEELMEAGIDLVLPESLTDGNQG